MRSAAHARRLRQVLRRAAVLAVPVLLGGLLLPAAVPAARAATCGSTNLALNQPATASSTENASFPASSAVDGNTGTRWSSAFSDPQWLEVDLGSSQAICQVVLQWETAYATAFQIQVSPDGVDLDVDLLDHDRDRRHADAARCPAPAATSACTAPRGPPSTATPCGSSGCTARRSGSDRPAARRTPRSDQPATASSTENAGVPGVVGASTATPAPAGPARSLTRNGSRSTSARRQADLPGRRCTGRPPTPPRSRSRSRPTARPGPPIYSTTTGTGGTQTLHGVRHRPLRPDVRHRAGHRRTATRCGNSASTRPAVPVRWRRRRAPAATAPARG